MPTALPPDDHPKKARQKRGRYPWEDWLKPGNHLLFHQRPGSWGPADFPGVKVDHFRQTCYNAASRLRVSVSAKVVNSRTLEVWVYEKED